MVRQARYLQQVLHPAFGFGIFNVFPGLHCQAGGKERRRIAGVVPEVKLVKDKAGSHRLPLPCSQIGGFRL